MKVHPVLTIVVTFLPLISFAQESSIPSEVLDSVAADLAELQRTVEEAQRELLATQTSGFGDAAAAEVIVTSTSPAIRLGAARSAALLTEPAQGRSLDVIDKADGWYAVRLEEPVEGYSTGWISTADVLPVHPVSLGTSVTDVVFRRLTEQAIKVRDSYRTNPYITVSGFTVNFGIPPSITVNLDLKE